MFKKNNTTKFCSHCGVKIDFKTKICMKCRAKIIEIPEERKNPGVAAVLSFFYVGLGQIYNGQIAKGAVFILIGILFIILMFVGIGLILYPLFWIYNIYDAYKMAKKINRNNTTNFDLYLKKNKSKIIYLALGLIILAAIIVFSINRTQRMLEINQEEIINQEKIMQQNNLSEITIDKNVNYTAVIKTTKGDIKIELFAKENPITVNNFVSLAQKGFYNGVIFHRVISGFMIQAGCPYGTGMGGPGYTIPDEFRQNNRNDRGTISMANAGPNTGGSQFFINLVNNNFLDNRHPAFGRVIEGMEVVDAIGNVPTNQEDRPIEDVIIKNIEIIK